MVLSRTHHPIGFAPQTSDEPRPVSPTDLDSRAAVIYSAKAPSRRRGKEGRVVHAKFAQSSRGKFRRATTSPIDVSFLCDMRVEKRIMMNLANWKATASCEASCQ